MAAQQEIRFCTVDGSRVAVATSGGGPPLVMPSWWVSHVERDWARDDFRAFVAELGRARTVVRYDRLGTGLSDRDPAAGDSTTDGELRTLDAVLDRLELDRVDLFGMSGGGSLSVALAARSPERVRRLVLHGAYADGSRIAPAEVQAAMPELIRLHWGMGSRLLADVFVPGAGAAQRRQFDAFQRAAAPAERAAALLELVYRTDVTAQAEQVRAPTLVTHRRKDRAVPFALGRDLAALIPGARLLALDGDQHLPWLGNTAALLLPVLAFLTEEDEATAGPEGARPSTGASGRDGPGDPDDDGGLLSRREREVLRLVARGLSDREIAAALVLSPHTVHRHVANLRTKLGEPTRTAAVAAAVRRGLI